MTVNLIPTIAYGNTNRWQYKRYRVPDVGAPKRTETQGSRGDCPIITPIMPQISNPQSRKYSFGTTISEYPTLFFHIGKHSQRSLSFPAKFLLKDEQNNTLYRQDFQLVANQQFIDINLPSYTTLKPHNIDQNYQWSLSIDCSGYDANTEDQNSETLESYSEGFITRLAVPLELSNNNHSFDKLSSVYAELEIWQDALMIAAQLRRLHGNNTEGNREWNRLLSLIGLETLARDRF